MTDKEREAWQALLAVEQAAVDKIKDLLNPLPEPTILSASTKWPPKGMIVEVWDPGTQWVPMYSHSDGYFAATIDSFAYRFNEWRYPPAPWHLAPEWAAHWVVWATGESTWQSGIAVAPPLDRVLHVENRPEVDHEAI